MKESTIQEVFTFRDWNDSTCDCCCDYKSVVLLADERVCHDCLLKWYDESGEFLGAAFQPEHTEENLWDVPKLLAATVVIGLAIGHLASFGLTIVAAWVGGQW